MTPRDLYRKTLAALDADLLVAEAIGVYLEARRERSRHSDDLVSLCWAEFASREGVANGPLWEQVLAGVREAEEKVRAGNRMALERMPRHMKEKP